MFKHILVPVDGSESSTQAAESAVTFAKAAGAEVTAFFSMPDYSAASYYGDGALLLSRVMKEENARCQAYAQEILGRIEESCRAAGVKCRKLSLSSEQTHTGIIDAATRCGCDLIYMASHGCGGADRRPLGSQTDKVLTHSRLPVLVYRPA